MTDFGPLALTGGNLTLAITCTLNNASTGNIYASDVRFNNFSNNSALRWFVGAAPACGSMGYYDLKGIATHEMGHTYGMAHATDVSTEVPYHLKLTMSKSGGNSVYCQTDWRTLGLGDMLGLEQKY